MDHTNNVRLNENELTEAVLNGAPIYGAGGEKVGTISETYGSGADTFVVVDVGGFLGVGAEPLEMHARDLNLMRSGDGVTHGHTKWTKDELKDMPEYMPRAVP